MCRTEARLSRGARAAHGRQRVVEIWLFMLPQVNDGSRLLAALVHHESDSAHGNNLAINARKIEQN